jgi:hypothetical protein
MISRSLPRAVVPPLLGLGLVSLLAGPVRATVSVPHGLPAPSVVATSTEAPAASTMSVTVPAVAFTAHVVASHGRIRVPVLLTDPTVTARVTLESSPACGVDLVHGVTGWIDCPATVATTLVVTLSDGRTVVHAVEIG